MNSDLQDSLIHDDLVYPLFPFAPDHPFQDHCQPFMSSWSPDAKKLPHPLLYQIPRSQNIYPHPTYHDVKSSAPFIATPVQRDVQQQQQHPHSGQQLQQHQQQLTAPAPVFNLDEEWQQQQHTSHFEHHGHLASFPNSPSDPPRIKQEELSAFPAYHHHSPLNNQSLPHDPIPSFLSPIQTHHLPSPHDHPQPQSAPAYYSSPFHLPSQLHATPAAQHQLHLHVRQQPARHPHPPHDARSFPPFSGGTVHPAELSPTTDSCTSVSPLSTYADLSAAVVGAGCDPRFVHHQLDLKNSLAWRDDRRGSLASIHSDLSAHSHGIVEIEMGLDGIDGLGANMSGIVAGGMPMDINEPANSEEDAAGEEDAEGEEDWEQPQPQTGAQQFQIEELQYLDQGHDQIGGQMQRDEDHHTAGHQPGEEIQQQQQQQNKMTDNEGEDGASTDSEEGAEAESGREIEAEPEYDSELSESESEEDDDDADDPEFVPRPRRRPLRRQSTYPVAGSESTSAPYHTFAYTSIAGAGEGRTLRPRSSSARYTPYPSSYPDSSSFYSSGEHDDYADQQDAQSNGSTGGYTNQRAHGKRCTSTTSSVTSSSTHAPRSASSLSGSSGLTSTTTTTTTTTARRRLRPSNTLPIPIPVPNLTKKSRGRRVPTMSSLEDLRSAASGAGKKRQSGGKTARMYLCDVEGCGKCFARGEHLKRHVRSIHTYEKPHKCLYPGCGKDFSRHDNLGQHMRVHKDYVQEGVTVAGSTTTGRSSSSSSSRRKAPSQN